MYNLADCFLLLELIDGACADVVCDSLNEKNNLSHSIRIKNTMY